MSSQDVAISDEARNACDGLYHTRPPWVAGTISHFDARYLFWRARLAEPAVPVEIGTASGVSTAILRTALSAHAAADGGSPVTLFTYDVNPRFFADNDKETGDAARAMLDPEQLEQIVFRNPATALDVSREHLGDSVDFLFLDADHRHPWPTLDILTVLDVLRPGAEIVLHDIDLPSRTAGPSDWGAKWLFDGLTVPKAVDRGDPVPNIGSCWVPTRKEELREQLVRILYEHPWDADVPPADVAQALEHSGAG